MQIFNAKKHNGLEYDYELLYIYFQTYEYGGITDGEYESFKSKILNDSSWKKWYGKLSKWKFKKYNKDALFALIRLLDSGAITKDEYCQERKKIVIEYRDKRADYYDL